jgi:hypothetical protein
MAVNLFQEVKSWFKFDTWISHPVWISRAYVCELNQHGASF